ncbi:MAG: leucine-rich repeat protein [Acutalibacteraceae bacterium]
MKKLTKIISLIMIAVFFLSILPYLSLTVSSLEILKSGNYEYRTLDNGTVAITRYDGTSEKVIIPQYIDDKQVVCIDGLAFDRCENLTHISIPDSVIEIGDSAFRECSNLTSINVESNNTKFCSIDGVLFDKNIKTLITFPANKKVSSYTISNSVTTIYDHAFEQCINLTSVTIPHSVTKIGAYAFCYCINLTSVSIPKSITSISGYTFCGCENLTNISIPDSVTSIGEYSFWNCKNLTNIRIPDKVTIIKYGTFCNCNSLTNVSIPDSITSIDNYAFELCNSLTSITIPRNVISIGNSAFRGCISLESVAIPDSLTSIGNYAFGDCKKLKSITIPNSVTSIGTHALGWYLENDSPAFTIYGTSGSAAEKYANENAITFIDVNASSNLPKSTISKLSIAYYGKCMGYLTVGQTANINTHFTPLSAETNVNFYSTNPSVATVDKTGKVTAISKGTTYFYAVSDNGLTSQQLRLYVTNSEPQTTSSSERIKRIFAANNPQNTNFAWMLDSKNFAYWNTYISNDSSLGSLYQVTVGQMLFQDDGLKNMLTNSVSVDKAEEILLNFLNNVKDDIYEEESNNIDTKLSETFYNGFLSYLTENDSAYQDIKEDVVDYLGNYNERKDFFKYFSKDKAVDYYAQAICPQNPSKVSKAINDYLQTDEWLHALSDIGKISKVVGIAKYSLDEFKKYTKLCNVNASYIEFLDYIRDHAINPAVKKAAENIRRLINNNLQKSIGTIAAKITANEGSGIILDITIDKCIDAIGSSASLVKAAVSLGVAISNTSLINAGASLDAIEKLRLISDISRCARDWTFDAYNKSVYSYYSNKASCEIYAGQALERYQYLVKARYIGESLYYNYYNQVNSNVISTLRNYFGDDIANTKIWIDCTLSDINNCGLYPEKQHKYYFNFYEKTLASNRAILHSSNSTLDNETQFTSMFEDINLQKEILKVIIGDEFDGNIDNVNWEKINIDKIRSITCLNCSSCNIKSLRGISNLSSIVNLNLKNNNITEIPEEITTLSSLKYLDLSDNLISNVSSSILSMGISDINLDGNYITDDFDCSLYENVSVKNNFIADNEYINRKLCSNINPINVSTDSINLSKYLYWKEFDGDTIAFTINENINVKCNNNAVATDGNTVLMDKVGDNCIDVYVNNIKLISINVNYDEADCYTENSFYSIFKDPEFAKAVLNSVGFDESINNWDIVTDKSLSSITSLSVDNITNDIKDISGISKLRGLVSLNLSNQNISLLPYEIKELTKLQYLDLSGNSFTNVPNIIESVSTLDTVLLHNNYISQIPEWVEKSDIIFSFENNLLNSDSKYGIQRHIMVKSNVIYGNKINPVDNLLICDMDGICNIWKAEADVIKLEIDNKSTDVDKEGYLSLQSDGLYQCSIQISGNSDWNGKTEFSIVNQSVCTTFDKQSFEDLFPDQSFRKAIFDELGQDIDNIDNIDYSAITDIALKNITSIDNSDLKYGDIKDLKGISYLTSLNKLNISNNSLDKVEALEIIRNIQYLNLSNTNISNINEVLNYAERAYSIDISFCTNITDYSWIENLKELTELNCSCIGDKGIIEKCMKAPNLRKLFVAGNSISNFSKLNDFERLVFVDISGNIFGSDTIDVIKRLSNNGVTVISNFTIVAESATVLLGDVNGDGEVTLADAIKLQRAVLDLIDLTEAELKNADVDGDGRVNLYDAILTQKLSLKASV